MNPNHNILIETPRLLVRPLLAEDAAGMFEMDSDPLVHRYVGNKPVQNIEQIREVIAFIQQQYIDNGIGRWAIIEKQSQDFIGWTGFKLMKEKINGHENFIDFGYRLAQRFWGKGYATEAGAAVLMHGIKHFGFKDIYAMTDVHNAGSRRVLEKLNFRLMQVFQYDGEPTWRENAELTNWYKYLKV